MRVKRVPPISSLETTNDCIPDLTVMEEESETDKNDVSGRDKIYTETDLYKAMWPLFFSLKLLGLHHSKKYGTASKCMKSLDHNQQQSSCRINLNIPVSQIFSWFLYFVLLFGLFRMFSQYNGSFEINTELFVMLFTQSFMLLCVLGYTSCLRAFHRYEGLPKFFIEWHVLVTKHVASLDLSQIRNITVLLTIIGWTILLTNSAFEVYLIFMKPEFLKPVFTPFPTDSEHFVFIQIFVFVLLFYNCSSWIFPLLFDVAVCLALYLQFQTFNREFRKKCQHDGRFTGNIGDERLKHQKICKLVSHVDNLLSLFKASSLGCNIGLVICIIYIVIYDTTLGESTLALVIYLSWSMMALCGLLVTSVSGILVNNAVCIFFTFTNVL